MKHLVCVCVLEQNKIVLFFIIYTFKVLEDRQDKLCPVNIYTIWKKMCAPWALTLVFIPF